MSAIALTREIEYPESDGRPMAETEVHGQIILDLTHTLKRIYAAVPDVYVWCNMLFYYVEGDPDFSVAPDVFLVRGTHKGKRRTFKIWEEGRVPALIVEVTSRSTRGEDVKIKKALYERLGVEEYFLFDPLAEYLKPRLQGYRRVGGRFQPLAPGADGALASEVTGLLLLPEGERLRLRVAATGEDLDWPDELDEARQAAETARQAAETARRAAETARRAAESARQAAETQTDYERQARQAAEERVRALEAELARLRTGR